MDEASREPAATSWPELLGSLLDREKRNAPLRLQKAPGVVTEAERDEQVRWIVRLAESEGLGFDTSCLAVAAMDRVLYISRVQSRYVNCLALACAYMAMKVCEELAAVPATADVLRRLRAPYSCVELRRMELAALGRLRFDLNEAPSLHRFIQALVSVCARAAGVTATALFDARLASCVTSLLGVVLVAYRNTGVAPSRVAFGLLSAALRRAERQDWARLTVVMQRALGLTQKQADACRERVARLCGDVEEDAASTGANKENHVEENLWRRVVVGAGGGDGKTRKRARVCSKSVEPQHLKVRPLVLSLDDLEMGQAFRLLYG